MNKRKLMLNDIIPKLPMRNKTITKEFYLNQSSFELIADYRNYILVKKDEIELHFFEFKSSNPLENFWKRNLVTNEIFFYT
jgi:hypothetical protein